MSAELTEEARRMTALVDLAGAAAHDFNNLLQPILGLTELAMADLDPAGKEFQRLQKVVNAAVRATELSRRIVHFCHQAEQPAARVEAAALVSDMVALLRGAWGESVEIREQVASDAGWLRLDGPGVEAALLGLAADLAGGEGETWLAVTLASDGTRARITLDGPGALKFGLSRAELVIGQSGGKVTVGEQAPKVTVDLPLM